MKTLLKTAFLFAAGTLAVHAGTEADVTGWDDFKTNLSSSTACDLVITQSFTGTTEVGVIASAQENTITSSGDEIYTISNSNTVLRVPFFSLTISNIEFSNFKNSYTKADVEDTNTDYLNGGVILNWTTLTINAGTTFSNNSTANGNGGAIANTESTSKLTITGATFTSNSAAGTSSYGGAIYNAEKATIESITELKETDDDGKEIVKSEMKFSSNSAYSGGAIYNAGTIKTLSGTFNGNSATEDGGAIYNASMGTIDSITGTFTNNSASYGGAIYNTGTIGEISGTFDSNSAKDGGAIENYGGTIGSITGTFKNNSATENGGAIYNSGTGKINSISATFENNGTAIYNYGVITIVGGTEFTGNSYAINNLKTVYLSAGENETITINDAIKGSSLGNAQGSTIEIGIVTGTDASGNAIYAETAGTVILNNSLSGNTVNVRAGTLEVAENASFADNIYTQVNIWGGEVSLCDGFTLNRFYLDGGEITGTTYTIGTTSVTLASGTISGTTVNVSGISTDETKAGELTLAATTVNSSGNVDFVGTLNLTGTLNFTGTDTSFSATTFNPTDNAKIIGGTFDSLSLTSGQTLAIQNTTISGSVTNAGTLKIFNETYSNETTNTGTLEFNAGENGIAVNSAISGTAGTLEINAVDAGTMGTVTLNAVVSGNTINLRTGTLKVGVSNVLGADATLNFWWNARAWRF